VLDWSGLTQDRGKWQALVYTVMNLRVIQNRKNSWLSPFQRLVCAYELVVLSVGQSVSRSVGRSVGPLVGCLVDWSVSQSVSHWLVRYLVSLVLLSCLVS